MTPRGGKRDNPGGRPAKSPGEKAVPISLRLVPALLARVEEAATAEGLTRSEWIVKAILERLGRAIP